MPLAELLPEANHGEFALAYQEYSKQENKQRIPRQNVQKKQPGKNRETPRAPGNFEKDIHAAPILDFQACSTLSCLFQVFRLVGWLAQCFLVPEE